MQSPYYNYMNDDGHVKSPGSGNTPIGVISNAISQKKAFAITPAGIKKIKDKNEKMEDAISEEQEASSESLGRGSKYVKTPPKKIAN